MLYWRDEGFLFYSCCLSQRPYGRFVAYVLRSLLHEVMASRPLCLNWYSLDILGGPVGPVTFTALSTRSVNIQIDKGSQIGPYTHFFIQRGNGHTICTIPTHGILTECTDGHAKQGKNHYRIGAEYSTGTWFPDNYNTNTLQQDRTHFLRNC